MQKTIQDNLAGGIVTETAEETKEGRTYYEAKVQKSGGEEIEIKVDPDGKLISAGEEEENGEGEEDNDYGKHQFGVREARPSILTTR